MNVLSYLYNKQDNNKYIESDFNSNANDEKDNQIWLIYTSSLQ